MFKKTLISVFIISLVILSPITIAGDYIDDGDIVQYTKPQQHEPEEISVVVNDDLLAEQLLIREAYKGRVHPEPKHRELIVEATAYTISVKQTGNTKGITYTGTKVKKNYTIAVDPNVIPLGSLVLIESDFEGVNGEYVAEDTGGAIKGKKIDVFMGWGEGTADYKEALQFGRREVKLTVLREGYEDGGERK